jgi:hypothetical protein
MVELLTGQIAAACRLENQQLGPLAFGKGHIVPTSGLCPHWGTFNPNAFCNIS